MSDEGKVPPMRQSSGREQRKHPRKKSLLSAVLITDAGTFDCHVLDLSPGGARIETPAKVAVGQSVSLVAEAIGTHAGSVMWCSKGSFGMRFERREIEATPIAAGSQSQTQEAPPTFVEFKRFQGTTVFVNPAKVLYVVSQADGSRSEIHFGPDHSIIVNGDCKKVCSQLAQR